MKILVTGGTGLIGSHLIRRLQHLDHEIFVLSRTPEKVKSVLGQCVIPLPSLDQWNQFSPFDAVVNLAGEPIVGRRWSDSRKKRIRESRIELTRKLVSFMALDNNPVSVLISGSAIGYYGDRDDQYISENSEAGRDFGAKLCDAWEKEAFLAEDVGVRVCTIRTGLVLSENGGILGSLLLPYKLGLGGKIGSGNQYMSWIHIKDHISAIMTLLIDSNCSGPYNLTAPNPVTNKEFAKTLGKALRRPAILGVPAFLPKLALGEAAELLLGGQNVLPDRLVRRGFEFEFEHLQSALADLV